MNGELLPQDLRWSALFLLGILDVDQDAPPGPGRPSRPLLALDELLSSLFLLFPLPFSPSFWFRAFLSFLVTFTSAFVNIDLADTQRSILGLYGRGPMSMPAGNFLI